MNSFSVPDFYKYLESSSRTRPLLGDSAYRELIKQLCNKPCDLGIKLQNTPVMTILSVLVVDRAV